jgi:hypothetical protein
LIQAELVPNAPPASVPLFHPQEEFYELHRIGLHEIPVLSRQQEYTSMAHLRERTARLRREREYTLSEVQAEALALQEMEAELLTLPDEPEL